MMIWAFFLLALPVAARIGDYPIIERKLQTVQFTVGEIPDFKITFSDYVHPKKMPKFWVDHYETNGEPFSANALTLIGEAMKNFLTPELQSRFPENVIRSVVVQIVDQKAISKTSSRRVRALQTSVNGTRTEDQVTVIFDKEPSPALYFVRVAFENIVNDLTYYLANITALLSQDANNELGSINDAQSTGTVGNNPIVTPGAEQPQTNSNSSPIPPYLMGLLVCAGALTMVVVGSIFYVGKKKRRFQTTGRNTRATEIFLDEDNSDIFSFEAALVDSPAMYARKRRMEQIEESKREEKSALMSSNTPRSDANDGNDDHSDVFSGLDEEEQQVEVETPCNGETRSVFSFMTGWLSTGDRTEVVNNTSNAKRTKVVVSPAVAAAMGKGAGVAAARMANGTPKSLTSSLFTFSEEEEAPSDEDQDDRPNYAIKDDKTQVLSPLSAKSETPFDESNADRNVGGFTDIPNKKVPPSDESSAYGPKERHSSLLDAVSPNSQNTSMSHLLLSDDDTNGSSLNFTISESVQTTDSSTVHSAMRHGNTVNGLATQNEASGTEAKSEAAPNTRWAATFLPAFLRSGKKKNKVDSSKGYGSDGDKDSDKNITLDTNEGYNSDPGPKSNKSSVLSDESVDGPQEINLQWDNPQHAEMNKVRARQYVASLNNLEESYSSSTKGRRHTKSTTGDGTKDYQQQTMFPVDATFEALSLADSSNDSSHAEHIDVRESSQTSKVGNEATLNQKKKSQNSFATNSTESASHQLIQVGEVALTDKETEKSKDERSYEQSCDSLSFVSGDNGVSTPGSSSFDSSMDGSNGSQGVASPTQQRMVPSIVCRDCYAPPGKLKIVIHSTKDGPAVHTVKPGSSLEGHIYAGDLIISVDNVDTRSYTAEQVMKMMTARTRFERKITVLHFESTTQK